MYRLSGHAQYIGIYREWSIGSVDAISMPPPVIPKLADKMGYVRG